MKKILLTFIVLISSLAQAQDRFTSVRVDSSYSDTEITSINSNGDQARLNSTYNAGLGLSLSEHWDVKNSTALKFNYNIEKFKQPENVNVTGLDQSLIMVGVRHTYSLNPQLRTSLGAFLEEQLFLRQKSVNQLTADKFLNPVLTLDGELDLLKTKTIDLGAAVNLDITAPFSADRYAGYEQNFEVNSAFGYGGTVYARKYFYGYSIEASLFYKGRSTKTSVSDQSTINEGVAIRLAIPLGY